MAKLKGPLFSLGAAGAIGKAIVYFGWKGLDVAREYVIPANPKSTGQQTQRGYLKILVQAIHEEQAKAVNPLDEDDIMAYALLGSTYPTPRTWFNQLVKIGLDQLVKSYFFVAWANGTLTPAATEITLKIQDKPYGVPGPTNAIVWWGISKTALINQQPVTKAQLNGGVAITGMVTKTKYFLQVRPTLAAKCVGSNSGIYYAKTT